MISEAIAFGSMIVAAGAAIFAWLTWQEAKKSNQLSLHDRRLEVHRAIQDLRDVVQSEGFGIQTSQVTKFWRVLSEAKFCFKKQCTSDAIQRYFDACFELGELSRGNSRNNLPDSQRSEIEIRQDRASNEEQGAYDSAVEAIENEIYSSLGRQN